VQLPRVQFRLVAMMGSIGFVAAGLAALKQPYGPAITILLMFTIATLLGSAVRAPFAPTVKGRAWWFGFSLFGWTFLLLSESGWREWLPTTTLAEGFAGWYTIYYGPYPTPNGRGPWYTNAIHDANGQFYRGAFKLVEIYLTLVAAGLGATLARAIAARVGSASDPPEANRS
jgi:hypothetical protein